MTQTFLSTYIGDTYPNHDKNSKYRTLIFDYVGTSRILFEDKL